VNVAGGAGPSPVPPGPSVPTAPSNLVVTGSVGNKANLAFTDTSNNEEGFKVYTNGELYKTLGPGETAFEVELVCENTYDIYVVAYNAAGESPRTGTVRVAGSCPTPAPQKPAAPANLAVTGWSGTVANMAFTDASNNEAGFRVYANGGLFKTLGSDETTFQVEPPCGSTTNVYVTAYNAVGESVHSNSVRVAGAACPPPGPTVPGAPSNLAVTGWSGTVANMAFSDRSNNEDGFRVYANGGVYRTLSPNETAFQLSTECGATYSVYVVAFNGAGESGHTNTVNVAGAACPPPGPVAPRAPSNLAVTGWSGTMAKMAFNDRSDNEDGFRVYVNGGVYQTLGANDTTFQMGPGCGSTYSVYVVAFNAAGESGRSNTVNVTGACPYY